MTVEILYENLEADNEWIVIKLVDGDTVKYNLKIVRKVYIEKQ